MTKAILHVGTMKTGTTSIQRALTANAGLLAEHGYRYLGPPMRHSSVLGPALAKVTDPSQNLIISDEGLWHFADSKRSDTPELAKLLRNYEVEVVIYLRRPDSFIDSWFQQGLKSGTGSRTMSEFLHSSFVKGGLQFRKWIDRFESLFGSGSITLRAYEKSQLVGGDAVLDFLTTAGLPADQFKLLANANTTPDTDSLLLRSIIQDGRPRIAQTTASLNEIAKHLAARNYKGRRYSLLNKAELEEVLATYRPIFTDLQARYGGGVAPHFFEKWPDPEEMDPALLDLRSTQEALLNLEIIR